MANADRMLATHLLRECQQCECHRLDMGPMYNYIAFTKVYTLFAEIIYFLKAKGPQILGAYAHAVCAMDIYIYLNIYLILIFIY